MHTMGLVCACVASVAMWRVDFPQLASISPPLDPSSPELDPCSCMHMLCEAAHLVEKFDAGATRRVFPVQPAAVRVRHRARSRLSSGPWRRRAPVIRRGMVCSIAPHTVCGERRRSNLCGWMAGAWRCTAARAGAGRAAHVSAWLAGIAWARACVLRGELLVFTRVHW